MEAVIYKGEVVGMVTKKDGKYHGRCFSYFPGTTDIFEEHHYNIGVKHGECTKYFGSLRFVEHYDNGKLIKTENIFETDKYIGITTTTWFKLTKEEYKKTLLSSPWQEIKKTTRRLKHSDSNVV